MWPGEFPTLALKLSSLSVFLLHWSALEESKCYKKLLPWDSKLTISDLIFLPPLSLHSTGFSSQVLTASSFALPSHIEYILTWQSNLFISDVNCLHLCPHCSHRAYFNLNFRDLLQAPIQFSRWPFPARTILYILHLKPSNHILFGGTIFLWLGGISSFLGIKTIPSKSIGA